MNKKAAFFLCVFVINASIIYCQESMVPEVNYTYLGKLIDTAKKYYPKVLAFQHAVNSAQKNVSKTKLSWFDALAFTYQFSPNNTTTLTDPTYLNGYQFGFYFNLGIFLQKLPAVKIAKEDLEIAKLQAKEYDLNIEALVKQRYFTYIGKQTILSVHAQAALDAEASLKDIKYRYQKGEETFDTYSKALQNYSDMIESKIESESELLIAKSALEEIVGKKLEEIN